MMRIQTMYYVVTRRLGESMQGSKSCKGRNSTAPRGTIYAVKESQAAAEAYVTQRWGEAAALMLGNTILIVAQ
jgi:hypothetical protein